MYIAEVFTEIEIFASNLVSSSKSFRTPKFYCFNSMDHKGSISLLISYLGVNRLKWQFIPNNRNLTKINSTTSHGSVKDWTKIQGRFDEYNQFYSPISPRPQNPWSSHNSTGTLLRMKHIVQLVQNPQSHQTLVVTTTTQKILDTLIISFVSVPKNMQDL
jgi:hypothetical protein